MNAADELLMTSRKKVFSLIDVERVYQDSKWGALDVQNQSFEGFLLILQEELNEARLGWMKNKKGRDSAIHEVLQVAAVATACLEQYAYLLDGQMPRKATSIPPNEALSI